MIMSASIDVEDEWQLQLQVCFCGCFFFFFGIWLTNNAKLVKNTSKKYLLGFPPYLGYYCITIVCVVFTAVWSFTPTSINFNWNFCNVCAKFCDFFFLSSWIASLISSNFKKSPKSLIFLVCCWVHERKLQTGKFLWSTAFVASKCVNCFRYWS